MEVLESKLNFNATMIEKNKKRL